ncbi:MAG: RNA polymerase sigma factor [Flammeovirgaceae bacterium]
MNKQQQEFLDQIQTHSGIIHKVIGLYVDLPEDRKDLYQEILLQAWKSFDRFRGASRFSTWLYRVSLNTVLTFQRKDQKKVDKHAQELPQTGVKAEVEQRENSELLYLEIKKLNEIDRMIITLHLDGYKNGEIAEITGLKVNHINVKLHRVKQQIIEGLKKRKSYGLA